MTPIIDIAVNPHSRDDLRETRAKNPTGTIEGDRVADAHTLREVGTCTAVSGCGSRVAILWDRQADGRSTSYRANTVVTIYREGD